jgi:hypothetical protein
MSPSRWRAERRDADLIGGLCESCCWSMRRRVAGNGRAINCRRDAALGKGLRRPWIFAEFLSEMP